MTIVIDPKGDADLMLRMYAEAKRAGRLIASTCSTWATRIFLRATTASAISRALPKWPRGHGQRPALVGQLGRVQGVFLALSNIVAQAQVALGRVPTHESLLKDVTGIDGLFMDYATMVFGVRGPGRFP